jgi:hypothetical protein
MSATAGAIKELGIVKNGCRYLTAEQCLGGEPSKEPPVDVATTGGAPSGGIIP